MVVVSHPGLLALTPHHVVARRHIFQATSDYSDKWCQLGLTLERTPSEITAAPSSSLSITCVFSTRDRSLLAGVCRSSSFQVFRPPWLGLQGSRLTQPSRVYLSLSFIPMQDKASGGTGNQTQIRLEKRTFQTSIITT